MTESERGESTSHTGITIATRGIKNAPLTEEHLVAQRDPRKIGRNYVVTSTAEKKVGGKTSSETAALTEDEIGYATLSEL